MRPVRLASLNLHGGRRARGSRYSVATAVESLIADVVVLQENWRPRGSGSLARQAAEACGYPNVVELDLLAETTLYDLGIVSERGASESGAWGLAVLSRIRLVSQSAVQLGFAAGDVGPRAALVADLVQNGRPVLRLVNVHLTHRVVYAPSQLRRLIAAVPAPWPVAIVGDLNMCRPAIHLAAPARPVVRARTWPAHRPVAQLDHVLAGPEVRAVDGRAMPAVGSDHLPIRVSLTVPPDRASS